LLSLDKAFTYDLPAELEAGVGSYVRFRFHGKLTKGWVLGPTSDLPARTLPVMRAVSPVRFFDAELLDLARWISTRYVTPLAEALGVLSPPRVASEEPSAPAVLDRPVRTEARRAPASVWGRYTHGSRLESAIVSGEGTFVVRPAPEDEQRVAVEAVRTCLAGGRRAIVLVPEASPPPATVAALEEAFGDRLVVFAGGDARARYRTWLRIKAGEADVVVGTRPAVFAPLPVLGLLWVARESHPAHREERAPYHHVRDVALRRAAISGGVAVLAALCPSTETAALGLPTVVPSTKRWPKVEIVRPGPEGRAPRLVRALGDVRRAFLFSPLPGAGVAQVCRTCGAPAACAVCGGTLRASEGEIRCVVCEAPGRCAVCGGTTFGVRRGGAERVEAWATRTARVPVTRVTEARLPAAGGEVLVGGADAVRDLGVASLDLVAILDADLAARRPGLTARERALAIWMEAVGWARPAGSAIVQTAHPGDAAVQALVRGSPDRFHERERERREAAGFPVGAAVFRVIGTEALEAALAEHHPITSLVTSLGGRTVCLLALEPDRVPAFGDAMRRLAAAGVVERVEAEPHL
jgi:primosomal protein N' (replication factor Y)